MKCVHFLFISHNVHFRFAVLVLFLSMLWNGRLLAAIDIDYQTFKSSEPGREVVDLYFTLDNSQIVFVSRGNGFEAQLDVSVFILNDGNSLTASQSTQHTIRCSAYEETTNPRKTNLFRFPFHLPPGVYEARLQIADRQKSNVETRTVAIRVPDYHSDKLQISSLVLKTDGVTQVSPILDYHHPIVDLYFETYNAAGKVLQSEIRFVTKDGHIIKSIKGSMQGAHVSEGFSATLSFFDIPPGNYSLQLIQSSAGQRAVSQKKIIIHQSPVDLRFKSFARAVSELRYIATGKELSKLEHTIESQQQEAINTFWKAKDPTPATAKNEALEEYYRRIEVANALFSKNNIQGWLTDRGMIYILFGKPDVIFRETSDGFHAYRQDWQYKKLRLSFVFIAWRWFEDFQLLDRSYVVANYLP